MQNIVSTGTENSVNKLDFKQTGPRIFKWLFVIETADFPEMIIESCTQERYEQRMQAIRDKGYSVAAYNITAIEDDPISTLDEFLEEDGARDGGQGNG